MSSYPLTIVSSDDFVYTNQQVRTLRPRTGACVTLSS
jgi:hypothetical protein